MRFLGVAAAGFALALCLMGNDSVSTSAPATITAVVSLTADHSGSTVPQAKNFDQPATPAARFNYDEEAMVVEKAAVRRHELAHFDGRVIEALLDANGAPVADFAIYYGNSQAKVVLKVGQLRDASRISRAAPSGDPAEQSIGFVYGRDARSHRLVV